MHIPERRRSLQTGNAWTDAARQQRITVHSTSSIQPYHCCLFGTMSALPTIKIYSTGADVKGQSSAWEHGGLEMRFLYEDKGGNCIILNYSWLIA